MDYKTFANSQQHINMKNRFLTNQHTHTSKQKIHESINGNAFYPFTSWPLHTQLTLTATPIDDTNTFKILLFFYGNGCSPELAFEFIYASHTTNEKIDKRFYQIKWICNNLQNKKNTWYYFDINQNKILHLDKSQHNNYKLLSTPPIC